MQRSAVKSPGPAALARLTHRRWMTPLLAHLADARGARFVVLTHALGAARPIVRVTLDEAVAQSWVRPNPGYGHPLRPEYILTNRGLALGRACTALVAALRSARFYDDGLRKWSLPVLLAIRGGRRFSEVRAALPIATDRAIGLALKKLVGTGLAERTVVDAFPPTAVYVVGPRGRSLAGIAARAARSCAGE